MSRRTTCVWVEQEDGDAWGCDRCGVLWVFHAYSPQEDKNMRFCPRCGRRITKWIPLSWGSEEEDANG